MTTYFVTFRQIKRFDVQHCNRATTVSTYITYIPVLLKQWKNQELQIPIWICTYLAWEHHKVGKIRVTTRKLTMHHDAFWNFFFVWLKMKHDADDPIYVLFYQFREFWCYPVTCNFWTTVERVEPAFDFVHGLIKQSTKS